MDLDEEIIAQLMATFNTEAEEHVNALNDNLLILEKRPAGKEALAAMEELFREAHSLKGAARAVDLLSVEELAHGIENVFSSVKKKEVALTGELFDLLYRSVDLIGSITQAAAEGAGQPDANIALVLQSLESASQNKPLQQVEEPSSVDETQESVVTHHQGGSKTIRVATNKLDSLMIHVEELLVSKIRTEQRLSDLKGLKSQMAFWYKSWLKVKHAAEKLNTASALGYETEAGNVLRFLANNEQQLKSLSSKLGTLTQEFDRDNLRMSLITEDLQHDIRKVRMLPISTIFSGYERLVRDVAKQSKKEVALRVFGSGTELDKKVLEGIKDPIMHILRNSVDHGLESPEMRVTHGKPKQGTVVLRAMQQGGSILIEVEDDGAGIDIAKVRKKALDSGMMSAVELRTLSDREVMFLIFKSGFSTAGAVSNVSGRGVGLDVVRQNVEALKGMIELESTLGVGTKFSIILPLTLSTSRVLLAKASGETFAVPTSSIERILRVSKSQIHTVGNKQAVKIDERPVSLVRLDEILELPASELVQEISERIPVIVLGSAEKRVAFAVEGLVGETEVVVKSLSKQMSRVRNVAGATILGTGKVVMILNVADLLKSARSRDAVGDLFAVKEAPEQKRQSSVLVVDDSITTRTLEKNILEAAGFRVHVARDGLEAMETLKHISCDLVVSDVDMPGMNGLDLTAKLKSDQKLKDKPVVLVTSLESQDDRERGIEVGADAYIVKSGFNQQDLLHTIQQLL